MLSKGDLDSALAAMSQANVLPKDAAEFSRELTGTLCTQISNIQDVTQTERKRLGLNPGANIVIEDRRTNNVDLSVLYFKLYKKNDVFSFGQERMKFANHGAHDQRAFEFLKDIKRMEAMTRPVSKFAILLTNDERYWMPFTNTATLYYNFRLEEGRVLRGTLVWPHKASEGSKKGLGDQVTLLGSYTCRWQDYRPGWSGQYSTTLRNMIIQV